MSVSTGRILTTELKGQSIGKSSEEALIPGYRLTVNCFQEQMDSADLREIDGKGEQNKQEMNN